MPQDPDRSEAFWQGHYGTKPEADAIASDIEKLAGLQGHPVPRTEVTPRPQGRLERMDLGGLTAMIRDWIFLGCANGRHEWRFTGGANAGCGPDCHCSVPVHECENCGDCDYGDNPEADQIRLSCDSVAAEAA